MALKSVRQLAVVALAGFAAGVISVPARAVEPDGPSGLINAEMAEKLKFAKIFKSVLQAKDELALPFTEGLSNFYAGRGYELAWIKAGTFSPALESGIAVLKNSEEWGLKPASFRMPADAENGTPMAGAATEDAARADLAISRAFLTYAIYARTGQVDPTIFTDQIVKAAKPLDPAVVLEGALKAGDLGSYLLGFQPKSAGFLALKAKLDEIRGGAEPVKKSAIEMPAGPNLKPGARHEQIGLLRQRLLVALAPGQPASETNRFDPDLVDALKEFQRNAGLKDSGVLNGETRNALNGTQGPVNPNAVQLILTNMERQRWMPDNWGDFYVNVNIPEFLVRVVSKGEIILTERVVTGKPDTQTPVFSDQMETIEFMPYWNVPDSIKVSELLPGLRSGGGILARRGLELRRNGRVIDEYSVDWSTSDPKNYEIAQPPGGGNVLGVVKFLFPNQFSVYMHDTPSKSLFASAVRTFSHGCMRVRNPLKLAEVLLSHDKGWTAAETDAHVSAGVNDPVPLDTKIAVHVTYFTASIDETGKLRTLADPYGIDRKVSMGLAGKIDALRAEGAAERARLAAKTRFTADPGFDDGASADAGGFSIFSSPKALRGRQDQVANNTFFNFGQDPYSDPAIITVKKFGKNKRVTTIRKYSGSGSSRPLSIFLFNQNR